jgi:Nuclease-related domain
VPRPPLAGPGGTGLSASPRSTRAAGRSALMTWRQERRARRRRLVLLGLGVAGLGGAMGLWLGASVGLVGLGWPAWPLLVAVVVGAVTVALLWPRSDPSRWARGAAGELVTAALLERLPGRRWIVLHDLALPGSQANIDHLVIGPTGVWVVDTKAYRARVLPRRRQVLVAGAPVRTAAVRWEAQVVSRLLGVTARPVIAMHANGLPRRGRRVEGVRALPAPQLVRRLRRGQHLWPRLRPTGVRELAELAERSLKR